MLSSARGKLISRSLTPRINQIHNGKGRPDSVYRQFSSRSLSSNTLSLPTRRATIHPATSLLPFLFRTISTTPRDSLFDKTPRVAPVESIPPTNVPVEASNVPTQAISPSAAENAWDPNFMDGTSVSEAITPHIGYLHELGLNYGWGPTSVYQWVLEHISVYTGLPWFVTIPLTVVAIRAALFPLYISGAEHTSRFQKALPLMLPVKEKLQAAKANGDQQTMMESLRDLQMIRKRTGAKQTRIFLPMALQVPLAYGAFNLLRGMANVPVPGFSDGGILWFTDLTIPDPYFIIPAATSVIMFFAMKRGSEMGQYTPEMQKSIKILPMFLAPVSFVFASFWPAALTLNFLAGSIIAFFQTRAMQNNTFRAWLGLKPMGAPQIAVMEPEVTRIRTTLEASINKPPVVTEQKTEPKGIVDRLKKGIDFSKTRKEISESRASISKQAQDLLATRRPDPTKTAEKERKQRARDYESMRRAEIKAAEAEKRNSLRTQKRNVR